MPHRTVDATPASRRDAARPDTADTAHTTVPASLLDAVMDVDAAIDDGGLELQEALTRMHQELAYLVPGPDEDAPAAHRNSAPATTNSAPTTPQSSSSRT